MKQKFYYLFLFLPLLAFLLGACSDKDEVLGSGNTGVISFQADLGKKGFTRGTLDHTFDGTEQIAITMRAVNADANGWPTPLPTSAETLADWRIYETEIGSKVFKGSVEMPEGELTFRFYSELTGWGSDDNPGGSIGWQAKDEAADFELSNGVYEGNCMPGKGGWRFANFPGGKMNITVDRIQNKVKFELAN